MEREALSGEFAPGHRSGTVCISGVVVALLVLAGCSNAPRPGELASSTAPRLTHAPFAADTGSIAVHCETLIDGVSAQPAHDVTVIIRSGHIASLAGGSEHPKDIPWLDLPGHTCLPGLIDMHTHLTDLPTDTADLRVYLTRTDAEAARISAANAEDRALRDVINRGEVAGPRMQVVGFYLTIPGGGGDLLGIPGVPEGDIPARARMGVSRGPEEFARHAQLAIDGGADLLKVIASGAVLAYGGVPAAPEMTPEEIAAVVKVAHAAGRKVAAHAHGAQSIRDAILAGADTIEHASLIDDADIELALRYHVALSMDVYNGDYIDTEGRRMKFPEEFLRNNLDTTEVQRQGFTRAHAAGVAIVFGSDASVYPHGLNARQFPIMVARGMTPMEAIQSATSLAARYMGWSDRVGALQPGLMGDLIAVKGNPLDDISRLQQVELVIKGGIVFKMQPEAR